MICFPQQPRLVMSRLALTFLFLAGALVVSGCKKQWAPFYQLDAEQQILVAREGEPGYLTEDMARIIAALEAVPANAREREQALALASKLKSEVARVKAEDDAARAKKARPVVLPPAPVAFIPPPVVAAPPPDAGAALTEPYSGMTEAQFLAAFGTECFRAGPPENGPDGGPATTQLVLDRSKCIERFGTPGRETRYLFYKNGGLWGSYARGPDRVITTVTDAGSFQGQPYTRADAGERILTIPGAPIREGYQRDFGDAGP